MAEEKIKTEVCYRILRINQWSISLGKKSLWEMEIAPRVQILDDSVCISCNTFAKGMNSTIHYPDIGKIFS